MILYSSTHHFGSSSYNSGLNHHYAKHLIKQRNAERIHKTNFQLDFRPACLSIQKKTQGYSFLCRFMQFFPCIVTSSLEPQPLWSFTSLSLTQQDIPALLKIPLPTEGSGKCFQAEIWHAQRVSFMCLPSFREFLIHYFLAQLFHICCPFF